MSQTRPASYLLAVALGALAYSAGTSGSEDTDASEPVLAPDFRQFRWGDPEELIVAREKASPAENGSVLARQYEMHLNGRDVVLSYGFENGGLKTGSYSYTETLGNPFVPLSPKAAASRVHSVVQWCDDMYRALERKYGAPRSVVLGNQYGFPTPEHEERLPGRFQAGFFNLNRFSVEERLRLMEGGNYYRAAKWARDRTEITAMFSNWGAGTTCLVTYHPLKGAPSREQLETEL